MTSVSVLIHLWSFSVGQFCQHIVAVCHHSSVSLGTTGLSSLHTHGVDVSCLFYVATLCSNRTDMKVKQGRPFTKCDLTKWTTNDNSSLQGWKKRCWCCAQVQLSKQKFNLAENIQQNRKSNKILTFAKVQCELQRGKCLWWAARNQIQPILFISLWIFETAAWKGCLSCNQTCLAGSLLPDDCCSGISC